MRAHGRLVLTRNREDNARLRTALGRLQVQVIDYPCIEIVGVSMPETLTRLKRREYDAAIFVSRNAVEHLLASPGLAAPERVIAIGASTSAALQAHGWLVSAAPSDANVVTLLQEIDGLVQPTDRVLYVRGDLGEDAVPDNLRAAGRTVDVAVVYRTTNPIAAPLAASRLPTLVVFASPSAVKHFRQRNDVTRHMRALAIGETTAAAARQMGFTVDVSRAPDTQSLIQSIRDWQFWVLKGAALA